MSYRLAFIRKALIIPNRTIHVISTPTPLITSGCSRDHPFFITFLTDSIANVNGKHREMKRRLEGIPSSGHTSPKKE